MNVYVVAIEQCPYVSGNQAERTLNTFSENWYRSGTATWIVVCSVKSEAVYEAVKIHMPPANAGIFICRFITDDYFGLMPQNFWKWLKAIC